MRERTRLQYKPIVKLLDGKSNNNSLVTVSFFEAFDLM